MPMRGCTNTWASMLGGEVEILPYRKHETSVCVIFFIVVTNFVRAKSNIEDKTH